MVLPSLLFLKVRIFKTLVHEARFIDGLEGCSLGIRVDRNYSAGFRKTQNTGFDRYSGGAGFVKIWERDAVSVLAMEMTEDRDAGLW